VQFGGQTPLNLALGLARGGVRIVGTQPEDIEAAEDRKRFGELVDRLGLLQPRAALATTVAEAEAIADRLGYPVLMRPLSCSAAAMVIVYDRERLARYMPRPWRSRSNARCSSIATSSGRPRWTWTASRRETTVVGAIMEHVELAGIHSGDSACTIPAPTLAPEVRETIRRHTAALAASSGSWAS